MIKLEGIHIQEFRGIRELSLDFGRKSFVIRGPNGSGKSGVVDAIEFALTGEVSRLTGRGTGGLSVGSHGPHVDRRDHPDEAVVTLSVFIPELNKNATITRQVSQPHKPTVDPDDEDVLRVLEEAENRPELTLTRREIIKFILTEATKRSKDVQALLRLDSIDQARATLKTAQNKLGSELAAAESRQREEGEAFRRHLGLEELSREGVLKAVNQRRTVLGLQDRTTLGPEVELDAGVADAGPQAQPKVDRKAASRDLDALEAAVASLPGDGADPASSIVDDLNELRGKPELEAAFRQRVLVDTGLGLLVDPSCPLCDTAWDMEELRTHLSEKLERSRRAAAIQQRLRASGQAMATAADTVEGLARACGRIAESLDEDESLSRLITWAKDLADFATAMRSGADLSKHEARLTGDWAATPVEIETDLAKLRAAVAKLPVASPVPEAALFLTRGQDRWGALCTAKDREVKARRASDRARATYKAYCDAAEVALGSLYGEVEERFSKYYRRVNESDEAGFAARLRPTQSKLDLSVDFYERGLFPPGAYHSEGHQDGMGVCLYLALMHHLLADRFTLAVLDDVVMSVDSEHRREFCRLLQTEFPDTQFIITTHDQVWAEQIRSVGLVSSRSTTAFYGWTIDTGPIVEASPTLWEEVEADIERDNIAGAAATLRRQLEAISRELASGLVAAVPFRADNSYDLGDLLPNAVGRLKKLLGKAAQAAQSWGNGDAKMAAAQHKEELGVATAASNCEQWALNKAVHYNEWANLSKGDFVPVVAAIRELLSQFQCSNPECTSWLHATPRKGVPEALKCSCGMINFSLSEKPKT